MSNTFLGTDAEKNYDKYLNLPIVSTIRKQEQEKLHNIFDKVLHLEDTVLEIGAGTGFYTQYISPKVKSVTAVEPSNVMLDGLRKKIIEQKLNNIALVNSDFFEFQTADTFDHVLAIGVLDYVEDWQAFLNKCLGLALKSFIFTAPQKGLWTKFYQVGSAFEKIKIYVYTKEALQDYFKNQVAEIQDVGLRTRMTKGFNLIVKIEKHG